MKPAAETLEHRIRERAYYIWEASGRPSGRDEEFWQQACALTAAEDAKPARKPQRRERPAQTPGRPRRDASRSTVSAPPPPG